ncbi:MAG: VanZ family protein [Treponema sp.]|nr:VanZ family protein [Treponema sp.]
MKKIILKLPALITMGISWYLSSGTLETLQLPSVSDKLIHLVCFAGLGFFWTWWFKQKAWIQKPLKHILLVTLIVAAYGIVDEIHQYHVPGRYASILDWVADFIGGLLGGIAGFVGAWLLQKIKIKNSDSLQS